MFDNIKKIGSSKYRVNQTPESQDEEKRRRQHQQEEQEKKEKQKSNFNTDPKWSKITPEGRRRTNNSLLGGRSTVKLPPDVEAEILEESKSVRILKQWKILNAMGGLRPGVLLSYIFAITVIVASLGMIIRIIFL